MAKPKGSRGRGVGRSKASAASIAQAAESSPKKKNKNECLKEMVKNVFEAHERRMKEEERRLIDSPRVLTRSRTARNENKATRDVETTASNKMVVGELSMDAFSEKKQSCMEQEKICESPFVTSTTMYEKLSLKPLNFTDKALLAREYPPLDKTDVLSSLCEQSQVSELESDDKRNWICDFMVSNVTDDLSLKTKNKIVEKKSKLDESLHVKQHSKGVDKPVGSLDYKSSKLEDEGSLENEKTQTEFKQKGNETTTKVHCFKDMDNQKLNWDQQDFSSENKNIVETKLDIDETSSLVQASKSVETINQRLLNVSTETSIIKNDILSENPEKLDRNEKIVNLKKEVNLRFEFDTFGRNNLFVENKDEYATDNQKITFNIGDGDVKLSFIDNKVCISTQSGEIDCSIRKDQVNFSLRLTDLRTDVPSKSELVFTKDVEPVKKFGSNNMTAAEKIRSLHQSEELNLATVSENDQISTLQNESSCKPRSLVQQQVQTITDNFLASVLSSCDDFKNEFIECLKKKIDMH